MAKTVVGLEITEECVRAVEVSAGRAPVLVAHGEVALPPGAAKDSEVLDADAVAVALRTLWTQTGIKGRDVVLGVGSRRILVREYSSPSMSMADIKASLPYQVQDLLPVPADQAVLDFYPLSESGGQVHGLLVAAVSEPVEQLIDAVAKAKLRVTAVDLVPFGLARVGKIAVPAGRTAAIVYIGAHTTFVTVVRDGVPHFVRVIAVDVLPAPTADPAISLVDEVEDAFAAVGGPGLRGRSAARMGAQSDPGVADLAARVRSTLAFYASRPDTDQIASVLVAGPGTGSPEVVRALEDAIDVPLSHIDINTIVTAKSAIDPGIARGLVSTLGVVLGGEY